MKASEEFVVGKHGIGWVNDRFKDHFKDVEFATHSMPSFKKLEKSMKDVAIENDFKPGMSELGDIIAFLDNAPEECKDGYANLFYFPAFVVFVYWFSNGRYWSFDSWERVDFDWVAGVRVFSPATVNFGTGSGHYGSLPLELKIEGSMYRKVTEVKKEDVTMEVWNSSENRQNRQERHYFVKGGDRGYQHNTYLFGYNPEVVSEETAKKMLELITLPPLH